MVHILYQFSLKLLFIIVSEKITENEAVKLIRFRGGLCKLSEAYTALGKRCQTIFEAQRELAQLLPDMSTVEHLGDVKYRGNTWK